MISKVFYKFQSSKHFDCISYQGCLKASKLLTMIQNKYQLSRDSGLHLFHFDSKKKVSNDEIVSRSTRYIVRRVPVHTLSHKDSTEHDGVVPILTTAVSHEKMRALICKKRARYDVNSEEYIASESADRKRQRNENCNLLENKELSCGPQLSVGETAIV
jgi:hypothetical protein